jgi:hypothetical protein
VAAPQRRVVSLVPSLTEAVAATTAPSLVGVTDWCTHPATSTSPRIGGTKNPDVARSRRCGPTSCWRTRRRTASPTCGAARRRLAVWVTRVRSVAEAFPALRALLTVACAAAGRRGWTTREAAWAAVPRGATAARPSSRSGAGRGWSSAATRSPATSCAASASATLRATTRALPEDPAGRS